MLKKITKTLLEYQELFEEQGSVFEFGDDRNVFDYTVRLGAVLK